VRRSRACRPATDPPTAVWCGRWCSSSSAPARSSCRWCDRAGC